jgi:hypothetical protein
MVRAAVDGRFTRSLGEGILWLRSLKLGLQNNSQMN